MVDNNTDTLEAIIEKQRSLVAAQTNYDFCTPACPNEDHVHPRPFSETVLHALEAARRKINALEVAEELCAAGMHRGSDPDAALDRVNERIREREADAWDEGAQWAAVELGAIPSEHVRWVVDEDNPYRAVSGEGTKDKQ